MVDLFRNYVTTSALDVLWKHKVFSGHNFIRPIFTKSIKQYKTHNDKSLTAYTAEVQWLSETILCLMVQKQTLQ